MGGYMKKFLSKMPVMIVFLSLAVVGLVFYIVMLARPVSYGMTYTWNHVVTEEETSTFGVEAGTEISYSLKILNDRKMEQSIIQEDNGEPIEVWIIRNGNKFIMIPGGVSSEEEYDAMVEALKANKKEWDALWSGEGEGMPVFNVNAFSIKVDFNGVDINMTCTGAIVFASVFGVIEVALITFGALSLVFFLKNRKGSSTQSADTPVVE